MCKDNPTPSAHLESIEARLEQILHDYAETNFEIGKGGGLTPKPTGATKRAIHDLLATQVNEALVAENQEYLDRINNFKPKPGELTAASFGSAGAAIETSGWKHIFEKRIQSLQDKVK